MAIDHDALLEILNSTPIVDGVVQDRLGLDDARAWARRQGGTGSRKEAAALREVRDRLQRVVAGDEPVGALAPKVADVRLVPELGVDGLTWFLDVHNDRRLAVEVVLAWNPVQEQMRCRLRACANDECRLFLLDRSRANTARWCSMPVCGNRLKACPHHERRRPGLGPADARS